MFTFETINEENILLLKDFYLYTLNEGLILILVFNLVKTTYYWKVYTFPSLKSVSQN